MKNEKTMGIGSVVMLKSGGPKMSVTFLTVEEGANIAECQWWDGKEYRNEKFIKETLKIE